RPPARPSKPSFQFACASHCGSATSTRTAAALRSGLPAQKLAPLSSLTRPLGPPTIVMTLRWPILLSLGTRRQSSITSPEVMFFTLLGSPSADAIIIMQSWPQAFEIGVHLNGPTIFSCVLLPASVPTTISGVDIGCRSVGHRTPADGLQ